MTGFDKPTRFKWTRRVINFTALAATVFTVVQLVACWQRSHIVVGTTIANVAK